MTISMGQNIRGTFAAHECPEASAATQTAASAQSKPPIAVVAFGGTGKRYTRFLIVVSTLLSPDWLSIRWQIAG